MTEQPNQLAITIVHRISGRIRMRLSHPPMDEPQFKKAIQNHPGISSIIYTPVTGSLLIVFDTAEITYEELVVRTAVTLSRDYDMQAVKVFSGTEDHEMSVFTFYSGVLLVLSLLSRVLNAPPSLRLLLDNISGAGTAAAVIEHSAMDFKQVGEFHPEVLSIIYLVNSAFKKRLFNGSVITWLATFGRHLFKPIPQAVEVKVLPVKEKDSSNVYYEAAVSPLKKKDDVMKLFRLIPEVLTSLVINLTGMGERGLLEKIRELPEHHGQVLEGLENIQHGISVRMQ